MRLIFCFNLHFETWFSFNSNPGLRKINVLCLLFVFFLCVSRCNALGSTLPTMFPLWCSRLVCSVILTLSTFLCLIHVAYQSTCFCAEHNLHTQPLYVWPFSKTLVHALLRCKFKPWFTQAHALCQSASSY